MKKFILIISLLFIYNTANATDYSEMSTQELIAIMGYVKSSEKKEFKKELQSRVPTMNEKEKATYKKNLKKMKR